MGALRAQEEHLSERLLIVGADGLLGGALRRHWQQAGHDVLATHLLEIPDKQGAIFLDLSQPPETWPVLPACRAAVLCAGITSVEKCRNEARVTRLINVTRTVQLAERLIRRGAFIVFISSNQVFDGTRPRRQADEPFSPRTEYGRQKAEAEQALSQWPGRTAVVRLTKVFHPGLPLVVRWLETLSLAQSINAFTDYVCSPIELSTVVSGLAPIAENQLAGRWQFSGPADVSYFEIAQQLARSCGHEVGLVRPGSGRAANPEHLPAYTSLDADRARRELHLAFPAPSVVIESIGRACEFKRATGNEGQGAPGLAGA